MGSEMSQNFETFNFEKIEKSNSGGSNYQILNFYEEKKINLTVNLYKIEIKYFKFDQTFMVPQKMLYFVKYSPFGRKFLI